MQTKTILFLRFVLLILGTLVSILAVLGIPSLAREILNYHPEYSLQIYGVLLILYSTSVPFYYALIQSNKLLTYIQDRIAFSSLSVMALKKIKISAYGISLLYLIMLPFFYILGAFDDAPGIILVGIVMIFSPLVIGFFAAILQSLLEEAINYKSENELTI
jgi:hypothetical protein